jgi:hypothetical protein
MSSARRIAANERNAQHSSGPRTPAGKARVGRNALVHGLAVSILRDPAVSAQVDKLARALAGSDQEGPLLMQARIIAEADLELERIQITKVSMMNAHLLSLSGPSPGAEHAAGDHPPHREGGVRELDPRSDIIGAAMINVLPQLVRLCRYERRARSRRTQAMRKFMVQKAISTSPNNPCAAETS